MNGSTLKTIREALGLTVPWLAHEAGVRERSVRYWESSTFAVPADVQELMLKLEEIAAEAVARKLATFRAVIKTHGAPADPVLLVRYADAAQFSAHEPSLAGMPLAYYAMVLARVRWALAAEGIDVIMTTIGSAHADNLAAGSKAPI